MVEWNGPACLHESNLNSLVFGTPPLSSKSWHLQPQKWHRINMRRHYNINHTRTSISSHIALHAILIPPNHLKALNKALREMGGIDGKGGVHWMDEFLEDSDSAEEGAHPSHPAPCLMLSGLFTLQIMSPKMPVPRTRGRSARAPRNPGHPTTSLSAPKHQRQKGRILQLVGRFVPHPA